MKLLWGHKDGGPKSRVWCWGIESKRFGSILLLKFAEGSREAFHTHAFNSISWLFKGGLKEKFADGTGPGGTYRTTFYHWPSFKPIFTYRTTFHKVDGVYKTNWALSLRGPWVDNWKEWIPELDKRVSLTHGRREVK